MGTLCDDGIHIGKFPVIAIFLHIAGGATFALLLLASSLQKCESDAAIAFPKMGSSSQRS